MIVYQIPRTSDLTYDHIVGVIDCSGSMSAHWRTLADHWNTYIPKDKAITITFDTLAQEVESNLLDHNINYHGGGGTSIAAAFRLMEDKLALLPKEKNVLVLFVSDGQDNSAALLQKQLGKLKGAAPGQRMDFICLGIGKDFPTFVAMRLRKLYHTGEDSMPAIFLIEYASPQAFTNKFESLKPYFDCNRPRQVTPPVCLFPWRECTPCVFENSWVLSDAPGLLLDGKDEVQPSKHAFDGLPELFRAWAQTMHLDILHEGETVIQRARKTLQMMQDLLEDFNSREGVEVFRTDGATLEIAGAIDAPNEERNFKSAALRNLIKKQYARLKWFFDDVKVIAEGRAKTAGDQFEAAKLIALGTIFGGYNQRVLRLKRVAVEDYLKFREEFRKIFSATKLNPTSSQERSLVTLQNQKDLFLEPDFLEGLELCRNQIDLFESFPLVGQGLRIVRPETEIASPYFLEVAAVAKTNSTLDTTYINANKGQASIGTGTDQSETVNAVVPLFGHEDDDLAPLLTSKLFALAMTFNALKNADYLFEETHLALLANTLVFLLSKESPSQWRDALLSRVLSTAEILTQGRPEFRPRLYAFLADPVSFIQTDKEQKDGAALDLSKSVLLTFLAAENKLVDGDRLRQVLTQLFLCVAEQRYCTAKNDMVELLEMASGDRTREEEALEEAANRVRQKFGDFFSLGDLDRAIQSALIHAIKDTSAQFRLDKVQKIFAGKVSFQLLNALHLRFLGAPFDFSVLCNGLRKLFLNQSAVGITWDSLREPDAKETVAFQKALAPKFAKTKSTRSSIKCSRAYKLLCPKLRDEFCHFFSDVHAEVLPVPDAEIKAALSLKKVKERVVLNEHSLLPRNACAAPRCKFFLQPVKFLSHHFHAHRAHFPRTFHAIVRQHCMKTDEQIFAILSRAEGDKGGLVWCEHYGRTQLDTLAYISRVRKAYLAMLG